MNKRIEELADRLWRIQPSDINAMGLETRKEFYEHELKKFAELIIEKCGEIADENSERGIISAYIDKYFGVEQ